VPETITRSTRARILGRQIEAGGHDTDAGGQDEYAVSLAALDNLGVASDDRDPNRGNEGYRGLRADTLDPGDPLTRLVSIDRLILGGVRRLFPNVLRMVRPHTVIRWHLIGFSMAAKDVFRGADNLLSFTLRLPIMGHGRQITTWSRAQ
jgi:hypothetical protein